MLTGIMFLVFFLQTPSFSAPLHATEGSLTYNAALLAAQQKVERKLQASESRAGAQSGFLLNKLAGRLYRTGDSWRVIAWRIDRSREMFTPELATQKYPDRPLAEEGVFHFNVTKTSFGELPSTEITVTQNIDARVESIQFLTDPNLKLLKKSYKYYGRTVPLAVSAQGIPSSMTVLELFPLAPPLLTSALLTSKQEPPPLPFSITKRLQALGQTLSTTAGTWIEQDDFFGRKIEAFWRYGDPWPLYLKTDNSISILLREEPHR